MSLLLDDARRLAAQSVHEPYAGDHCVFCAGRRGDDPEHLPHCEWLVMPRIVAALEAAERFSRDMIRLSFEGGGTINVYTCGACGSSRTWSPDGIVHERDCPGQALVTAMQGEEVTA